MPARTANVIHLLAQRIHNGTKQWLLYPHQRWISNRSADNGNANASFLSLPGKRITSSHTPESTVRALLNQEIGLPLHYSGFQIQPRTTVTAYSPTHRVTTLYTITPAVFSVPSQEEDTLCRRLQGVWKSGDDALRSPLLSPTARRLIEALKLGSLADEPRARTIELQAVQAGDTERFSRVMEEMNPILRCMLRKCPQTRGLFNVPDDVEDVLAEVALRAFEKIHTFNATVGTAETWLWIITHNTAINYLRKRRPSRSLIEVHVDKREPDPAFALEQRDYFDFVKTQIQETLQQQSPLTRTIWQRRMEEKTSYKDLAEEFGGTDGRMGSLIFRVKEAIRSRIQFGEEAES